MTRREAYRQGLYTFAPPPVCTVGWREADWVAYVTYTVEVTA